jgi:hypothetical protein
VALARRITTTMFTMSTGIRMGMIRAMATKSSQAD